MVPIVLVMHAPLAAAFAQCAEHVLGGTGSRLHVVDITPDADVEQESDRLSRMLMQFQPSGSLVLCDLYGATPCNIARRAVVHANEHGVPACMLTGANLYMVLKALTDPADSPDELCADIRARILRGIVGPENTAE